MKMFEEFISIKVFINFYYDQKRKYVKRYDT